MFTRITKSLNALAMAALVLAPAAASAEKITKHTVDGFEEYYWTTTVTVKRGQAHTFWITGLTENTEITGFDVYCDYTYKEDGETYEDSVYASESCEKENSSGGFDKYILLTADDWEWVPESKSSLKFTVKVEGWGEDVATEDITFKFGHSSGDGDYPGEEEPVVVDPKGTETNPVTFSIAEANTVQKPGSVEWSAAEAWEGGSVYLKTSSLTAGRKYVFGFTGLTAGTVVSMLDADGNELFTEGNASDLFADCADFCWAITPEKNGALTIVVGDDSNTFTCKYAVYATRKPAEHQGVDYGDDDPDAHFGTLAVGGDGEVFKPGYLNDPMSGASDAVIDGKLFELSGLVKNTAYLFATEGASVPLVMRLYDSTGKILAANLGVADGDSNVRIAWTAPANLSASTKYYLGVCEDLEDGEEPSGGEVTLTAQAVTVENLSETLEVVATTADESPFDAEGAVPSAANVFSSTCWTHTYAIAARAGVAYHVKARLAAGGNDNGLALTNVLYKLVNAKKTALTAAEIKSWAVDGDLDPKADSKYLSFTPNANVTVYVDVSVGDGAWGNGLGLDYGPYEVCAVASGNYGVLKVDMKGATESSMAWKILSGTGITASKETYYPAGSSVILAAGSYTLVAQKVTGFATPETKGFTNVTVTAGATATAEYKYTDTYDPKDDVVTGATKLTPSAKGVTSAHSLWEGDVDWFSFTAAEGTYYKFALTGVTGAPEVRVYPVKSGVKTVKSESDLDAECTYALCTNVASAVQIQAATKGTYYVKVAGAGDCAYALVATSANPGVVKFAKTSVSVKDSAGYVDLSVSRSGKEGMTRVNYTTAGDQSSAENAVYYPTTGTLVWEDGDNKAKTIRVRIVPQNYGQVSTFQVKLSAFDTEDESFDKENEFPAIISTETATVTVTATAKAAPGTIQLADCDTPKKPVVDVVATNDTLVLKLERVSGTDGKVSVKVETTDKTAKEGTDYEAASQTFTWEDGVAESKSFEIPLYSSSDNTATKTFTVKLTAVTGKDLAKATLASSTITVNIANDRFATTVAAYATALKKTTSGIAIKESKAGSWFVRSDGSIYSSLTTGTLTFTLTGPGVFKYSVNSVEQDPLRVEYGQKKNNTVIIDAGKTLDWYKWEPLPENLVTLRQCVKYSYETLGAKVAAGKLPDGLKLAQDKTTKKWSISGTPTKAGYFYAKLTDAKGKETIEEINYEVIAAGTAIGTFSGLASTYDTEDGLRSLASVTLTATAAGKLTGKVQVGGKSYSFADTGYASFEDEGEQTTVTAELPLIQKIGSGKTAETVTNWLYCTIVDSLETDADARNAEASCEVRFAKLVDSTGKAYDEDIWYDGTLCRDNSKVADWVTEASEFAGYYTVSLVNDGASDGEPKGNGYLTLTFDAKGKVKIAGMLADGTSYSASSVSANLVDYAGETAIRIPLYACKSPYVFGGWLELIPGEDGALLVLSDAKLTWANDAATATRDGEEGFKLELAPVGGWYDTVTNLQKWFIEYDFAVDLPTWETDSENDLLSLLPDGYDPIAFAANPCGQTVDVYGDTVSVVKQSLVKDASTKLVDFENSVNAANVKFTFKRATGVLSGTFDLWYEGYNTKTKKVEQKSITGLKHNGVLLLSRGNDGYLEDDVWTSGFYLVPQTLSYTDANGKAATRKWSGSYRFDVKATYIGREWQDAE